MTGTVLITGSTGGLGRHLARGLSASGWTVLAHGRDPAAVRGLVGALPTKAWGYVADLASLSEVRELAEKVAEDHHALSVLVNNAAVGFGPPGGGREVSRDGHELRIAVNLLAPLLLTRLLGPLLRRSAPARVVNIGSIGQVSFDPEDLAFEAGYDGVSAYRRAKLALAAATFDQAEEFAGTGVTVNCVHPASFMPTTMVAISGVRPLSTVREGGDAVVPLVTDPAYTHLTGQFFNGRHLATAHPLAYNRGFRTQLSEVVWDLRGMEWTSPKFD